MEVIRKVERRVVRRVMAVAVGANAVLLAVGCSPSSHLAEPASRESKGIALTPDMAGFLADKSTTVCRTGGDRPCVALIRTETKRSSSIINADPASTDRVAWPQESYNGTAGKPVVVECYEDGENIGDFLGDPPSTAWYRVEVPAAHIQNPALDNHSAMTGYASVEWFHESVPDPRVPRCN